MESSYISHGYSKDQELDKHEYIKSRRQHLSYIINLLPFKLYCKEVDLIWNLSLLTGFSSIANGKELEKHPCVYYTIVDKDTIKFSIIIPVTLLLSFLKQHDMKIYNLLLIPKLVIEPIDGVDKKLEIETDEVIQRILDKTKSSHQLSITNLIKYVNSKLGSSDVKSSETIEIAVEIPNKYNKYVIQKVLSYFRRKCEVDLLEEFTMIFRFRVDISGERKVRFTD